VNGTTGTIVLRRLVRDGILPRKILGPAMVYALLYHAGLLPVRKAFGWLCGVCGGLSASLVMRTVDAAYADTIAPRIYAGALAAAAEHRVRGDIIGIATGSSAYVAGKIAALIGAEIVISNQFHIVEGVLVGTYAEPPCVGKGKLSLVEAAAAERGVPLSACTFYSDATEDLPLLAAVGYPVIVNARRPEAWRRRLPTCRTVTWAKYAGAAQTHVSPRSIAELSVF
jgi:phosphoserine phosphatase